VDCRRVASGWRAILRSRPLREAERELMRVPGLTFRRLFVDGPPPPGVFSYECVAKGVTEKAIRNLMKIKGVLRVGWMRVARVARKLRRAELIRGYTEEDSTLFTLCQVISH